MAITVHALHRLHELLSREAECQCERGGLTAVVKADDNIVFRGYSLENCLDTAIAEYGLTEGDILFVEYSSSSGWAFAFDALDPRYFCPAPPSRKPWALEQPSYERYWEHANGREFLGLEQLTPAYSKLRVALQKIAMSKLEPMVTSPTHSSSKVS